MSLIILGILSLLSLLYIFTQSTKNKQAEISVYVPQISTQANYDSIIPGVSTKEDFINKFGKPINTNLNTLEFKSLSPNRNNEVTVNQDKI